MPASALPDCTIYNILFTDKEVRNYRYVAASHEELNKILYLSLLTRGVFNAERGMFCMSTAMKKSDVDLGLSVLEASLRGMLKVIADEAPELIN